MRTLKPLDWHAFLKSGYRVFIGSGAACPHALVGQFLEQAVDYQNLEICHILTLGETPWGQPQYSKHLRINAFFLGPGSRDAVTRGDADYTPCFLSEIPRLFDDAIVPIDVALIQVSPPDEFGYCSFGVSVDIVAAACRTARHVIAQINPRMPRTLGQSFIHVNDLSAVIEATEELVERPPPILDECTLLIGKYASILVDDACTLQMGIGRIPDAVLLNLKDHNDLGVHTEMFSDGLLDLYKNGNITNKYKGINESKTITSFCFGTRELYDFVDNNPHVEFHPSEYTNQPVTIAKNRKMTSINSAIEIDLTGQVVADSIGHRFYSGIGGQVDFIRGACMCPDGRPIIALPSTAAGGKVSRIVARLSEGSGVVTSRGDVHCVVTEYGIATLRGRSIRERALELIQVAHPKFRCQLLEEARQHYHVPPYQLSPNNPVPDFGDVEICKMDVGEENAYLRPLKPSDQRRLQEFFYSHSETTLLQRYRHVPRDMSTEQAYRLVNVDQSVDLALCVIERQGPREVIHAVGRYFLEGQGRAEVAFVVREEKQGLGLGSQLLEQLIRVARRRKLKKLVAYIRLDNRPMQALVEKSSFQRFATDDPSELIYRLDLSDETA